MLKSLFGYVGGKARQATWIAGHVNKTPHKVYAEPCCGAASVFFAKRPSQHEALSDLDPRFYLLFKAIRDHPNEVISFCQMIEYSKSAFDESYHHLRGNPESLPDWKLGAWALFQCVASHAGWPDGHSFAWRITGVNPATAWAKKVAGLCPYAARLENVIVKKLNVLEFVPHLDHRDVLLYVDPPYFGVEGRYKVAKDKFDHEALAERLRSTKAKVIVSHYDAEPYISLYGDWRHEIKPSTQSCKGGTRDSPQEKKPVVEGLWFNY